jgi:acyl-CoA thioester hydrolase
MTVHIDMQARRTAPFPPDIRALIAALANAHAAVPWLHGIVRRVAMPVKS